MAEDHGVYIRVDTGVDYRVRELSYRDVIKALESAHRTGDPVICVPVDFSFTEGGGWADIYLDKIIAIERRGRALF